jgi:hypothetical protein
MVAVGTCRVVAGLALAAGLSALAADPADPAKKTGDVAQVIVFSHRDKTVRIPEIKALREVRNDQDQVILAVRAQDDGLGGKRYTVDRPTTKTVDTVIVRLPVTVEDGNPKKMETNASLDLTGRAPGTVRLTLIGADGKKAVRDVIVRRQVLLFVDETQTIALGTPKAVRTIENDGDRFMQVAQVEGDDKKVQLKGLAAADTRFTLIAADGERETIEVAVRSAKEAYKDNILLSLWQVRDLHMRSKKPMSRVVTENTDYVRVTPDSSDPRRVKLETRQPGLVQLTLIAVDGTTETYEAVIRRQKYRWQDEKNARTVVVGQKKLLGPTFAGAYKTQVARMFGEGELKNEEVAGDARHRSFTADGVGVWSVTFQPDADKGKVAKAEVYIVVAVEEGEKKEK